MSKKKVAKITLELELRDDWKQVVIEDCDLADDGDGISDKTACAVYRRRLEEDINNQQIELVGLLPNVIGGPKVRVKTFRVDYED